MIKQIYLPLTLKRSETELMFAQHDRRTREALDKQRAAMLDSIAQAEDQLNEALNDGFTVVSTTFFEERQGQVLHYVLHKPETTR